MIKCTFCGYLNDNIQHCEKCGHTLKAVQVHEAAEPAKSVVHHEDGCASGSLSQRVVLKQHDTLWLASGKYRIDKSLGKGGFGTVYRILDKNGKPLAFKLLRLWEIFPKEHDEIKERFVREFNAGQIESSYIVKSRYTGNIKGNPYIIMAYCPNGNLEDKMASPTGDSEVTKVAQQILKGLHDLHSAGIIHRDLKPENVLFDKNDRAQLTDFGISGFVRNRQTQTKRGRVEQIWGTVAYMPPEQLDDRKAFQTLGAVTDIFAFGVLMYEMFTRGKHPFGSISEFGDNRSAFFNRVKNGMVTPISRFKPDIHPTWEHIIHKCLSQDPEARFSNVQDMLMLLGQRYNGHPTPREEHAGTKNQWVLRVMNGEEVGRKYNLNEILINKKSNGTLLLMGWYDGAYTENDVPICDRNNYISTNHATLELHGANWLLRDGQWCHKHGVQDWHCSTNGTKVNYEKINHTYGRFLKHNDIVMIGDTTLKVIHV